MQCWTLQSWTDYSVVGLALCWPATLYSVQESVLTQSHIKLVCTCKIIAIYYWRLTFKLKLTVLAQHPFNDIELMSTVFRVLLPKFRFIRLQLDFLLLLWRNHTTFKVTVVNFIVFSLLMSPWTYPASWSVCSMVLTPWNCRKLVLISDKRYSKIECGCKFRLFIYSHGKY